MERQLLSGRFVRGEDAAVLRRPVSYGRDQLHVLPDAEREARRRLGGADAVAVQAHAESAAAHYARQSVEERGLARHWVLPGGGNARRQTGRAAVSAPAKSEKRFAHFRCIPRRAPAEGV